MSHVICAFRSYFEPSLILIPPPRLYCCTETLFVLCVMYRFNASKKFSLWMMNVCTIYVVCIQDEEWTLIFGWILLKMGFYRIGKSLFRENNICRYL